MILSAQSIRARCQGDTPMISPFVGEKTVVNGKSYGLSGCSLDVRIAHDLMLGPIRSGTGRRRRNDGQTEPYELPPHYALAHTIEDFHMPNDVCAMVVDKSSWARKFVSAMNTFIDAGFSGNLTLELVNFSSETVHIKAGDPICQIIFHLLDQPTEKPYGPNDKYYGQTKAAHPARYEEA